MVVESDKGNWSKPFIPQFNNSLIEPALVYEVLNKAVAHNLLSGHIIAIRYNAFIKVLEVERHVDFATG